MSAVAVLPFKASKHFVLAGLSVAPGDVVDVSMLDAAKITNMERGNYGIRVSPQQAQVQDAVARPPKAARKPSPRRKTSSASARKG